VSIDLFRVATAAEFAEVLVAATISNRSPLRRVIHQTRRAGRLVADAPAPRGCDQVEGAARRGSSRSRSALVSPPEIRNGTWTTHSLFPGASPTPTASSGGVFDEFQEIGAAHQPYGDPVPADQEDARDLPAHPAASATCSRAASSI